MGKKNKGNKGTIAGTSVSEPIADTIVSATGNDVVETTIVDVETIEQTITGEDAPAVIMENNTPTTVATVETVKAKRIPMSRVFIGGVISALSGNVDSVKSYVKGFMALTVGARKGYDNYWAKEDGFTNPESIMKLTPQGIGKMLAVLHHRAALYIADGGENASQTLGILEGIRAYELVAVAEAKDTAQNKLFAEALATMTKAMGGDESKARQALANFALTPTAVPAATVKAPEPTIGESGGIIEDADDSAPETSDAEAETANA